MSVDWRTVPAWVGSILTGGSFTLGFSLLNINRRNAIRAQAQGLRAWRDVRNFRNKNESWMDQGFPYVLQVWNDN